jgi:hypothetical protein
VKTTLQAHWFVLDGYPETPYRAVQFGADGNRWATPLVTAPTLAPLLLRAVSDPTGSYLALAIDDIPVPR